jgi:hypothetical protein
MIFKKSLISLSIKFLFFGRWVRFKNPLSYTPFWNKMPMYFYIYLIIQLKMKENVLIFEF